MPGARWIAALTAASAIVLATSVSLSTFAAPPNNASAEENAIRAFVQSYLKTRLTLDEGELKSLTFSSARVDLGGDLQSEYVVFLVGVAACGMNGPCQTLVLTKEDRCAFKVLGDISTRVPIRARSHKTAGWRDLLTNCDGDLQTPEHKAVSSFDGKRYSEGCVLNPNKDIPVAADDQLLPLSYNGLPLVPPPARQLKKGSSENCATS